MDDKPMEHIMKLLQRETYGFPHDRVIYDEDGTTLHVGDLDGKPVPPFGEKSFRKIADLSIRDDDIIIAGYPKTGCHWTWEVLSMIVTAKAKPSEMGKNLSFMELAPKDLLDKIPSRRVLNTHVWFEYYPKEVKQKKTKVVFTVRNIKDTAVSYYNHHISMFQGQRYSGPFNKWLQLFMEGQVDYGSFCDYHQQWDQDIKNNPDLSILIVSYEDMKEDLPREIRKMAEFVGCSLSDQLVEDIARAAGFEAMKQALSASVSHRLLRKGQVGDWKNWLTVAQSDMMDTAVEEKLKGTRFASQRYIL